MKFLFLMAIINYLLLLVMPMGDLKDLVSKAIEEFHRRFYPEVIVTYVGHSDSGSLAFEFTGHFCLTCGLHDYFDDFAEILSRYLGKKYVPSDKLPLNHGYEGWIVIFTLGRESRKDENIKPKFILVGSNGEIKGEINLD